MELGGKLLYSLRIKTQFFERLQSVSVVDGATHTQKDDVDMAKSAGHASRPLLASAYRISRFVREHALADRPHTSLWLAKTYVIPAGMYGSQSVGYCFNAGRQGVL